MTGAWLCKVGKLNKYLNSWYQLAKNGTDLSFNTTNDDYPVTKQPDD